MVGAARERDIKGLDAILERIRNEPTSVLVNRYLALVAEIEDQVAKQDKTVELAETLVSKMPGDALRIAHMAHQAHRLDTRPLDVMIKVFEAKGRYAKAEVLRIERDKLEKQKSTEVIPELSRPSLEDSVVLPPRANGPRVVNSAPAPEPPVAMPPILSLDQEMEDSRMAELDLGPGEGSNEGTEMSAIAMLFQDAEQSSAAAQALSPPPARAERPPEEAPIFTMPLFQESIANAPSSVSRAADEKAASNRAQAAPPQQSIRDVNDEPRSAPRAEARRERAKKPRGSTFSPRESAHSFPDSRSAAAVAVSAPQSVATSSPNRSAAADLFDHYWREGRVGDARDLIHQTAAHCAHEAWWQGRRAALELLDQKPGQKSEPKGDELPAPSETTKLAKVPVEEAMPADAFWQPLYAELTRMTKSGFSPGSPEERTASSSRLTKVFERHALARSLRPDFIAALSQIAGAHAGGPPAKLRALFWDLFMALWGRAPNRDCGEALEALSLTRVDPGFLGLYLDALIASGDALRARRVLRSALDVEPHLAWARVVMRRLPAIWHHLGVKGFSWSEDEGVAVLISRLGRRPEPWLPSMVAAGA